MSGALDIASVQREGGMPDVMDRAFGGSSVAGTPDDLLWLERYLLVMPSVTALPGPEFGVPEAGPTLMMLGLYMLLTAGRDCGPGREGTGERGPGAVPCRAADGACGLPRQGLAVRHRQAWRRSLRAGDVG